MKNKFVITVVGRDTVGIIAKVCTYLADHQVNILDISQTIVDGYFNMMMIVDAANAGDVTEMSGDLAALGQEIGVEELGSSIGVVIRCQHEDIFNMMHRI